jgi:REP element-mobilizing transposase RayT
MARKARAEVAGGLYHVVTRGNNRRQIFNSPADYEKFPFVAGGAKIQAPVFSLCLLPDD